MHQKEYSHWHQEHFPSLNALKFEFFCDNKEVQQNISFLLIYRKNCSKIQEFVNGVNYLLRAHTVDILLRDFNSKDSDPLTLLMESLHYVQIVKEPTFISGSFLDHVYISLESIALWSAFTILTMMP